MRLRQRDRDAGRSAAERIAAVLPALTRTWAPSEETLASLSTASVEPALTPAAHESAGDVAPTPRQARTDPGRRGAFSLLLVGALAAGLAAVVVVRGRTQEVVVPPKVERSGVPVPGATPAPASGAEVVVAVAGKVRHPGLVRLPAGSRVDDAVRAAGGLLPGADVGLLNLARRLVDGEQVLVGVAAPAAAGAPRGPPGSSAGGLLDLNAATAAELDVLPGIGPVLADRIIEWRTSHGPFASVDQLREVPGIGEAKYTQLKSKVRV